jgi:DNA-directed RNA polymerase subunit RPC12/RpoP
MTLSEAYEKRRQECLSLEREVSKLNKQLDAATKGLFTPSEKADLLKQVSSLKFKLKQAEKEQERYHNMWLNLQRNRWSEDFKRTDLEIQVADLIAENSVIRQEFDTLKATLSLDPDAYSKMTALEDEIIRLNAIINNDGANSGTPTSQTPLNKNKVIPNSREKTDRSKGGQLEHEKHSLASFVEREITDTTTHALDVCPACGGEPIETGERHKDEADYEVRLIKRRHYFKEYICSNCSKKIHAPIPKNLKEENQYGSSIQANILSLVNLGFVSINRTRKLVCGFLGNEFPVSEGYISKLQKRYSKALGSFIADVRIECLKTPILYWDDTVVFMNTMRGCIRFYGNERIALYKAHPRKNREGIDDDAILGLLSITTTVMHDHNSINYHSDFNFTNVECNQHLQRDLQKLHDISHHEWALQLKELITSTIHERKCILTQNGMAFEAAYVDSFFQQLNTIMKKADEEYANDTNHYYETDERRLINRMQNYKENYFHWVKDFNIPTTNNLSERSLRLMKTHSKVSGQFASSTTAGFFADIRTYLETCARNGINEFQALLRLTQDKPYSVQELLHIP